MLPNFNDKGYLPAGIHLATLDEVIARFGQGSPEREVEAAELVAFVAWARAGDIRRLILDGSFVTDKAAPNDVDLAILPGDAQPAKGEEALDSAERWPFLHIQVAADDADLEQWATDDFGTDRNGKLRGVVEVQL